MKIRRFQLYEHLHRKGFRGKLICITMISFGRV